MLNEKDIFNEKQETKRQFFRCPFCREEGEYDVRWMTRRKKNQSPRNMNQDDRARFDKSRDYMVRIDDALMCKNNRCRKRFDIPSMQTVVFL